MLTLGLDIFLSMIKCSVLGLMVELVKGFSLFQYW